MNEVLGFILMFAVTSLILVTATQMFLQARETTDEVVKSAELNGLANRFASRVTQAGLIAQDFPNATFETTLRVRPDVAGDPYEIRLRDTHVTAAMLTSGLERSVTTYNLNALDGLTTGGEVHGSGGVIRVTYGNAVNATENGPMFAPELHDKRIRLEGSR